MKGFATKHSHAARLHPTCMNTMTGFTTKHLPAAQTHPTKFTCMDTMEGSSSLFTTSKLLPHGLRSCKGMKSPTATRCHGVFLSSASATRSGAAFAFFASSSPFPLNFFLSPLLYLPDHAIPRISTNLTNETLRPCRIYASQSLSRPTFKGLRIATSMQRLESYAVNSASRPDPGSLANAIPAKATPNSLPPKRRLCNSVTFTHAKSSGTEEGNSNVSNAGHTETSTAPSDLKFDEWSKFKRSSLPPGHSSSSQRRYFRIHAAKCGEYAMPHDLDNPIFKTDGVRFYLIQASVEYSTLSVRSAIDLCSKAGACDSTAGIALNLFE
jgi:hypothetical protein